MKKTFWVTCIAAFILFCTCAYADNNFTPVEYFDYLITVDDTVVITGYHGNRQGVKIPASFEDCPVTEIGQAAFKNNAVPVKVTLPEGIVKIGAEAFCGCTNLQEIILPGTLEVLEDGAFKGCEKLEGLLLPDTVTAIGNEAFMD